MTKKNKKANYSWFWFSSHVSISFLLIELIIWLLPMCVSCYSVFVISIVSSVSSDPSSKLSFSSVMLLSFYFPDNWSTVSFYLEFSQHVLTFTVVSFCAYGNWANKQKMRPQKSETRIRWHWRNHFVCQWLENSSEILWICSVGNLSPLLLRLLFIFFLVKRNNMQLNHLQPYYYYILRTNSGSFTTVQLPKQQSSVIFMNWYRI